MTDILLRTYGDEVVRAGDEASGSFRGACEEANAQTSVFRFFEDGRLREGFTSKESIDGVGTKVQIYTTAFEGYIKDFEEGRISEEELTHKSVDIWERMLSDLIAMNTDDLRQGEMAVSLTNIIDINHLKGLRGKVFADTMAQAMGNVIRENDIMMTAGETAILGNPKQTTRIIEALDATFAGITSLLSDELGPESEVARQVFDIIQGHAKTVEMILQDIEFNIGGTATGISNEKNKLSPLRSGQVVVALQEKTKNGVIGPRSNGITAIRKQLTLLAGPEWENLSFEAFLGKISAETAGKIPEDIKSICRGKKMWEIATGKTTVFNPFVSRTLLGGVDGKQEVNLSAIIHVTGNPIKKTTEGAAGVSLELDISQMPVPTIIAILQNTLDINAEEAMKGWNMGLPYALVCDESEADKIIELARGEGIVARKIGVTKENIQVSVIRGVGVNKEEVQLGS